MKNNETLISVIIPYFKKRSFIFETINSVLSQSHKKFEIIIIYDDNDIHDLNYIKNFCKIDNRIKILINKKNLGVSKSRNLGVKESKGKFIAFLDSDDLWKKDKLKIQLQFMEKNKCLISHTNYEIFNKKNKILGRMLVKSLLNYNDLKFSCDIGLSTVMIDSKLKKKIFFPKIATKEDYVLWLRLSKKINIYGIPQNLASWRKNDFSFAYTTQKFQDAFKVYSKYEKFNFFKSSFFVLLLSFNFIKKSIIQKIYL